MIVLLVAASLLLAVIILFAFPQFSPIPYFPSNKKDLPLIIKALNLKNDQTVIDLGAGDGLVIFAAAKQAFKKQLNTRFIAVDINPVLIFIMYIIKAFHPNRKNIKIIRDNIFKINLNPLTRKPVDSLTFYLYVSPWYLEDIIKNLKSKIKNFFVVSYMYPVKSLSKKEKIIPGKNRIYIYPIVY